MKTTLQAVMNDIEAGHIDELFVIAHTTDEDEMITYAMGQTDCELNYDLDRAKLAMLTGHVTHSDYTDEDTPGA